LWVGLPQYLYRKAGFLLIGRMFTTEFVFGPMAAFTNDEGIAFFDPDHRNEQDLKIVIDALLIGLVQAANRVRLAVLKLADGVLLALRCEIDVGGIWIGSSNNYTSQNITITDNTIENNEVVK
jgi:hypothetical protein